MLALNGSGAVKTNDQAEGTVELPNRSPPIPEQQSQGLHVPPAEIGLGTLHGEEHLKNALVSKDRIFVLVLAKEIETFISRVQNGSTTMSTNAINGTSTSTSTVAALGPAMTIGAQPTSKFQRMLVYKAAEWYGVKAASGPEGSMIVGVLGSLDDKSTALKLSTLVHREPSPTQNFKIMQRTSETESSSRATSVSGDDTSSRWKSIEERETAYALAKERIYGAGSSKGEETEQAVKDVRRDMEERQEEDEEIDPVSRTQWEPVYPSLYHPPKTEDPYQHPLQSQPPSNNFAFQPPPPTMQYPQYGQVMNGYPGYNQPPQSQPQPPQTAFQQQQPYMIGNGNGNGNMTPVNGHYPPRQGYWNPTPNQNQQMQMQVAMGPQGWMYASSMPMTAPGPMPLIPQGMQPYPTPYPYQQQQVIMQPIPVRPGAPQHHSSTSSSISSRSYQDGSRPHSRGSTTSTRSGTSSVRLGAMYPVGQQGPGFRQGGMKNGKQAGMSGMTAMGNGTEGRKTRGQSPASTTSSRSSRRTNPIQPTLPVPELGQHPLPQRPDWSANNVPYHPSPIPIPASPTDFPPLQPRLGTNAEPMQVERARASNGKPSTSPSVWNAAKAQQSQPISPAPAPLQPSSRQHNMETDPDFPRRVPSTRSAPVLFDPVSARTVQSQPQPLKQMLPEDIIEAKLAAVSVSVGVSIGPPPGRGAPSYAKIVRRE
ncbi:hypothetical protein P7C73_g3394, partial [Tremellales sp. Uapishka_1]